jgi:hypothetical protein
MFDNIKFLIHNTLFRSLSRWIASPLKRSRNTSTTWKGMYSLSLNVCVQKYLIFKRVVQSRHRDTKLIPIFLFTQFSFHPNRYYIGPTPSFPTQIWNKHSNILTGLQLTNNTCEVSLLTVCVSVVNTCHFILNPNPARTLINIYFRKCIKIRIRTPWVLTPNPDHNLDNFYFYRAQTAPGHPTWAPTRRCGGPCRSFRRETGWLGLRFWRTWKRYFFFSAISVYYPRATE